MADAQLTACARPGRPCGWDLAELLRREQLLLLILDTSWKGREPCSRGDERWQLLVRQGSERASFSGRSPPRWGTNPLRPKWSRTPNGSRGSRSLRPSAKRRLTI